MNAANPRLGYLLGVAAFTLWGFFPLYFKAIEHIPALEIALHRLIWSALLGLLVLGWWKHPGWLHQFREHPERLLILAVSGALLTSNWLIYVWAVNNGRILETSLGYYINPLMNVLLGMVFLRERLRRLQWLALAFAAAGVVQQVWQVGYLPWVSLVLPITFAFYGLIRKQAPIAALPGLVVETWLLLPLALIWLTLHPAMLSRQAEFWTGVQILWLLAAGPITLLPMICFNTATRHLTYTTMGFLQYIAPTLVMLQAVFLFHEPLSGSKLTAFICIWIGLAIYSLDAWLALLRKPPLPPLGVDSRQ
ncbi:chloramphenical resistance permease RarD [Ventosimonas gracilis]|uniref:Chloramphenical resistance permease RarD n=1 Tax=Ventosimonas gracilis TaxID=1680762 RepID=A0A139SXT6_9GAMM|nr:EamA family transporter RarD [Ventosimonas gracilis]KXU39389.1 chloramphenical resistance permease RarD [Ventosimonas gracilis]